MGHPLPRVSQTCGRLRRPPRAAAAARPRLRRGPYGRCAPAPGPAAAGPGVPWRRSAVLLRNNISWAAATRRKGVRPDEMIQYCCQPQTTPVPRVVVSPQAASDQQRAERPHTARNVLAHFYMSNLDTTRIPDAIRFESLRTAQQCPHTFS